MEQDFLKNRVAQMPDGSKEVYLLEGNRYFVREANGACHEASINELEALQKAGLVYNQPQTQAAAVEHEREI